MIKVLDFLWKRRTVEGGSETVTIYILTLMSNFCGAKFSTQCINLTLPTKASKYVKASSKNSLAGRQNLQDNYLLFFTQTGFKAKTKPFKRQHWRSIFTDSISCFCCEMTHIGNKGRAVNPHIKVISDLIWLTASGAVMSDTAEWISSQTILVIT